VVLPVIPKHRSRLTAAIAEITIIGSLFGSMVPARSTASGVPP
jgi:hypothetical protein